MRVLDDSRRRAGLVWAHRATAERVSSARFRRLAAGLDAQGVPAALVARAHLAEADETRHAQLCAAMASELGTPPSPPAPLPVWSPLRSREDTLLESLSFCAISESLNATLMAVTLEHASHSGIRTLLHALLADEVQHSRLGWAHLAFERGRGSCAFLGAHLVPLLQAAVSDELLAHRHDTALARPDELALGLLTAADRVALIAGTLTDVVFPGLDDAGIDTGPARAWAAQLCGSA